MDLQPLQFETQKYGSGRGQVVGRLNDQPVTKLGWDSSNTITQMETHPDYRRQGLMTQTWDEGVRQAGYLRHSPDRTDAGNGFAKAESARSGKKLPKRQSNPPYYGQWDEE